MQSLWLAVAALLGHWRRHPMQLVGMVAGVWLATALWTGVEALNAQARADYARASAVLEAPVRSRLVPADGRAFDHETFLQLRRKGWRVAPVLEGRLRVGETTDMAVRLVGIEPISLPAGARVAGQRLEDIDLAAFTGQPGQAWVAPDTLRRLGAQPGERPQTTDGHRLPPLMVQESLAPGIVVVDIGHAQTLLDQPGQISYFLLDTDHPTALPAELTETMRLESEEEGELQRLTDSFHLNLTALGMLAFIVGLFIVHASSGLAFEQRRGTLRIVRACGVSLRALMGALALELGILAVAGGLLGVMTGYVVAAALLPDVAASLRNLYGAEVAGHLILSPWWWGAGMGMSLLGVLLAGLSTLMQVRGLSILALGQTHARWSRFSVLLRHQVAAGALLVVLALMAWRVGQGLLSAFVMVAATLLAAALFLPALLNGLLAMAGQWVRRPLVQWFIADSRQQLPALSLALMALLLALSASVGVGSMTAGFERTFIQWLDQRLAADLYVTPRDTGHGLAIAAWLQAQSSPAVDAIEEQWRAETRIGANRVLMQGVGPDSRLPRSWPLLEALPDAWALLTNTSAVMLSEQLARRLQVRPGDPLDLPVAAPGRSLRVVAVYADYGNPTGHMLVPLSWLRRHFPGARLAGLAVHLRGAGTPVLAQRLQEAFALDSSGVVEQSVIRQWSIDIFDRTFAATRAMNVLTLGVAGMALLISLLALAGRRLSQLAPLWALGVRRRQMAWLSLAQTLMLASLTTMLAMPLGILLAWCLVDVVNVHAFGWRLPLYVFPGQLLMLGCMGIGVSLLAALAPAGRLWSVSPAQLLREFSRDA